LHARADTVGAKYAPVIIARAHAVPLWYAKEIELRARRKLGQMLKAQPAKPASQQSYLSFEFEKLNAGVHVIQVSRVRLTLFPFSSRIPKNNWIRQVPHLN